MHRFSLRLVAFASLFALAGCVGGGSGLPGASGPFGDVTNAPVGAGVNVSAGTQEDFIVNVGRRIYFSENSAALDDAARETLNNQAAWLGQHTKYRIKVQGYADEPGGAAANNAIALQRAEAAKAYLVERGLNAGRIRVASRGNREPTMRCANITCWSQNRHVRTVLE